MILWLFRELWKLPAKIKISIFVFILFIAAGGLIGYLTYAKRQSEKETQKAKAETKRIEQEKLALQIIANTNSLAKEIENEKNLANSQAVNSNISNNIYANTRRRDSSQSSGNYSEARKRFCLEFPGDSKCR